MDDVVVIKEKGLGFKCFQKIAMSSYEYKHYEPTIHLENKYVLHTIHDYTDNVIILDPTSLTVTFKVSGTISKYWKVMWSHVDKY